MEFQPRYRGALWFASFVREACRARQGPNVSSGQRVQRLFRAITYAGVDAVITCMVPASSMFREGWSRRSFC